MPVNVGHLCEQQGLTACLPFFLLVGKGPVIVAVGLMLHLPFALVAGVSFRFCF